MQMWVPIATVTMLCIYLCDVTLLHCLEFQIAASEK